MVTDADSGLLGMGADVLAAVAAYVSRSEQRVAYREGHGRKLSQAHREQLQELRLRLDTILDPPKATEVLKRQFEDLQRRLEGMI